MIKTLDLTKITHISLIECDFNDEQRHNFMQYALNLNDKQNRQTNVKGIMSTWRVWEETDTYNLILDKVIDIVNKSSIFWIRPPIIDYHTMQEGNYYIEDAWVACYNKNDYTLEHSHRPNIFSFVYCVNGNKDHPPLMFRGNPDVEVQLKTNDLVIFPSEILHYVPVTHSEETRVVIAGNIRSNGYYLDFVTR